METQKTVPIILMLTAILYGCQPGEPKQGGKPSTPAAPVAQQAAATPAPVLDAHGIEVMQMAKDIGCLACHTLDKKLLGPGWRYVAAVNRGDPAAEDKLVNKITRGGSGVWGTIDMPAYPNLDEATKRTLVKFILSLEDPA